MTSTVTLYKSSIQPEKNFYIDDIESYLSGLDKLVITGFQYQKYEDTEKTIKINKNQSLQEINDLNKYNYCKIQNTEAGSKPIYYFILKRDPRAEETIKLELYMDTVNTLRPGVDFTFNNKSKLYRQHRDRFTPGEIQTRTATRTFQYSDAGRWEVHNEPSGVYTGIPLLSLEIIEVYFSVAGVTPETDINYDSSTGIISLAFKADVQGTITIKYGFTCTFEAKPIVDIYSEGISPILYKTDSKMIFGNDNTSWNLVYINEDAINPDNYNQVNAVECYAIPDDPIVSTVVSGSFTITDEDYDNTYLYINPILNNDAEIKFTLTDTSNNVIESTIAKVEGYDLYSWLKIAKVGSNLQVKRIIEGSPVDYTVTWDNIVSIAIVDGPINIEVLDTNSNFSYRNPPLTTNDTISATGYEQVTLETLDSLDRTDARLIKIIKLPYSPVEHPAYPDMKWKLASLSTPQTMTKVLKLVSLNTKFDYSFDTGIESPMYQLNPLTSNRIVGSNKSIELETKLLHSDFYRPKFVYDSFGIDFQLELVDTSNPDALTQYLQVGYVITTTIHSKFLFYFPQYILERSFVDFDNILPIARNNEVVLYTSQYINYLRTGYNYDVKAKTRQDVASVVGTVAAGIGGVAMGLAASQPWLIAMGIASFAASAVSTVNTIVNNEQQLKTKQAQLKQQAITVEGSDDVDLMVAYSNNKAFLNTYEISPRLKEALFNLFYYTGYVFESIGTPDISSRMYFNYVQASPIIDLITAIPEYAESDLKARYELGVTFLHNVKGNWDFEQQKENWEVSLGGIY